MIVSSRPHQGGAGPGFRLARLRLGIRSFLTLPDCRYWPVGTKSGGQNDAGNRPESRATLKEAANFDIPAPIGLNSQKPLPSLDLRFGPDLATGQHLQSGRVRIFQRADHAAQGGSWEERARTGEVRRARDRDPWRLLTHWANGRRLAERGWSRTPRAA